MTITSGQGLNSTSDPAHRPRPPKVLTAVPLCDGHDSPILTINFELARHGIQVVYLGYHRPVRDIVRAAIQEDVQAIGLSSYNGGHIEFFTEVLRELRRHGAGHIGLFGGGGATITPTDAALLKRRGVDEIFFAGTSLSAIVQFVQSYRRRESRPKRPALNGRPSDQDLAKWLTAAESRHVRAGPASRNHRQVTVGITGPGGAGKTTLIDELALRFLTSNTKARLAILSHDPGLVGQGALLADRATMVYAPDDRVFMRSLATDAKAGGLSKATPLCVQVLKSAGFDLLLVESAGIGQEDLPFGRGLVEKRVVVLSPNYGGQLQLQKIVSLDAAELVVVNKTDLPGARTALAELEQRLASRTKSPKLIATTAKRHGDPGVDRLFQEILS